MTADDDLLPLPTREPWQQQAACAGVDPDLFFPGRGAATAHIKAICATCPVTAECLQHALDNDEKYGIWGGKSEKERRVLRRGLPQVRRCVQCGHKFTFTHTKNNGGGPVACMACRPKRLTHPDHGGNPDDFRAVQLALEILTR